jgi:hypothetical protein
MLMDLGPNVYQEDFERAFLKEAAEFYQARARGLCACRPAAACGCTRQYATGISVMG